MEMHGADSHHSHKNGSYLRLLVMVVLSFISMYAFMYAMVDSPANIYSSFNQFYMAGLMTAPMVIIEIAIMSAMYMNKKTNAMIVAASVVALVGCFALIRNQTAIGDSQFLRSMIPHHAGAILMCEQLKAENPTIRELCKGIITGQQAEIQQMKTLLSEISR